MAQARSAPTILDHYGLSPRLCLVASADLDACPFDVNLEPSRGQDLAITLSQLSRDCCESLLRHAATKVSPIVLRYDRRKSDLTAAMGLASARSPVVPSRDPIRRLAHPREIAVIVRSLDHNVIDVDHRDPADPISVVLDVIPTSRPLLRRVAVGELLPRRLPRSCRSELLPRPIPRLRRATVKRHTKKRHPGRHAGQIRDRWHARERASAGRQQT